MSWLFTLLVGRLVVADTISAQRIEALKQLISPAKVTVGPDDQFQSAADPTGKYIVFTHRADLVAHLRAQDLATGLVSELTPLDADAQDASFADDGRLAFTYYKFNARGDICYVPKRRGQGGRFSKIGDVQMRCLKRAQNDRGSERSSPFWVAADTLGYVVREIDTQSTRLVAENLKTHQVRTLAEGKVWAPTMKSGGRYLVFSTLSVKSGRRHLAVKDLRENKVREIQLAVPGASGFAAISEDEAYVYFSHFLNDTNQDQSIDGGDNAVVFRVPLAQVLSSDQPIYPEQLTSVENSCSFPRPRGAKLFVTCAFEGALDIYTLPATGMVPLSWDKAVLEQALRSSRSYGERVLMLNTLKTRGHLNEAELDERLLSTYLLDDDTAAARFYLARLDAREGSPQNRLLGVYLDARELKQAQPPGEMSRAYLAGLRGFEGRAGQVAGSPRFRDLVLAHLRAWRGAAEPSSITKLRPGANTSRLERFLYFQLADSLLVRRDQWPRRLEVFRTMILGPETSEEGRLYYAFNGLTTIADQNLTPKARRIEIDLFARDLPAPARSLCESEKLLLDLEVASEADKQKVFGKLDEHLRGAAGDYFLRKAMNVRAVLFLTHAGDNKYLEAIAANWLRDTNQSDTEFIYAREVVSTSALDEAYGYQARQNYAFAASFFYSALSLTDDLEAHAGYVNTEVLKNERQVLESRYQFLRTHGFVAENMKYVEALLALIDAKGDEHGTKVLDQAILKLLAMGETREAPVRQLLLGYAYMEKLRRTANGLEFDNALFEKAHRALMLAYDQGRDNERIRAAALTNLGLLHQRAGNFGLSARFFGLRKLLAFGGEAERTGFAWYYSRSLFHIYQFELAARELSEIKPQPTPLKERQAFYTALNGDAKAAADLYREVWLTNEIHGDMNLAKVQLGYGFALYKAKREAEARPRLEAALAAAGRLPKIKRGGERVLDFEPRRMQLIASGLLARFGSGQERRRALETRAELLKDAKAVIDGWEPAVILNELQMAELSDEASAAAHMKAAFSRAASFADENGFLGNAVYRTLVNYLSLAKLRPDLYRDNPKRVKSVVEKALAALEKDPPISSVQAADALKLRLLYRPFGETALNQKLPDAKSLLETADAQNVRRELPGRWREIEALARIRP